MRAPWRKSASLSDLFYRMYSNLPLDERIERMTLASYARKRARDRDEINYKTHMLIANCFFCISNAKNQLFLQGCHKSTRNSAVGPGGFFCVRMEHIVKPQSSLVIIQPRTLHASKLISLLACRVRGFLCVYRILFICVDWWSLPLPLGRRAASQLAPRATRAYSASSTTLHTQRAAGSRARVASKPCRRHAACLLSTIGWLIGDHMTRARVPTRAKVFAVAYLSTVGVFWYVRQAFIEHAAGAARPVQSRDTLVWDNLDLQMEAFGK